MPTPLTSFSESVSSLEPRTIFISPSMPPMPSHSSLPPPISTLKHSPLSCSVPMSKYKPINRLFPSSSKSALFLSASNLQINPKCPVHSKWISQSMSECPTFCPISESTPMGPTPFVCAPLHRAPSNCIISSLSPKSIPVSKASTVTTVTPPKTTCASLPVFPCNCVCISTSTSTLLPEPADPPSNCVVVNGNPCNCVCSSTTTSILNPESTAPNSTHTNENPCNCVCNSTSTSTLNPSVAPNSAHAKENLCNCVCTSTSTSTLLPQSSPASNGAFFTRDRCNCVCASTSTPTFFPMSSPSTSTPKDPCVLFPGFPLNCTCAATSTSNLVPKLNTNKATSICALFPGTTTNCISNLASLLSPLSPITRSTSMSASFPGNPPPFDDASPIPTLNPKADKASFPFEFPGFHPKCICNFNLPAALNPKTVQDTSCAVSPGNSSNAINNSTSTSTLSPTFNRATSTSALFPENPVNCVCSSTSTSTLSPHFNRATSTCLLSDVNSAICINTSTSTSTLNPQFNRATSTCALAPENAAVCESNSTLASDINPPSPPLTRASFPGSPTERTCASNSATTFNLKNPLASRTASTNEFSPGVPDNDFTNPTSKSPLGSKSSPLSRASASRILFPEHHNIPPEEPTVCPKSTSSASTTKVGTTPKYISPLFPGFPFNGPAALLAKIFSRSNPPRVTPTGPCCVPLRIHPSNENSGSTSAKPNQNCEPNLSSLKNITDCKFFGSKLSLSGQKSPPLSKLTTKTQPISIPRCTSLGTSTSTPFYTDISPTSSNCDLPPTCPTSSSPAPFCLYDSDSTPAPSPLPERNFIALSSDELSEVDTPPFSSSP
ncbi:mucin-2-like [Monodelphis domestica]|uniref:mucin-2-like n=1 Tax=Monodelphis domestica TaxID=13616 RepID=UPI00028BCCE8|nr:mucin-2-like [Monodelphis domestica]XP_007488434.1 mucin-2-like [Monodelphis domestica]XP_007488437.1 mucin-2-like [Monodelphis domestica]XP_007488438.1 mucin-2-like [Monodelphis domestica]XP_007488440.1 mucin-2-like [Monodelphis domestica]XP_007488441.1 mucin-2-like [Monodelphis domestica]XP_007488442.1 mucin-2-like [Monodelphis domestica]XP_016287389.1 mucin-2-like [Monodelphis domestica]XP_056679004.1 mucin-2-like [Monodelphis domestica]